MRASLILLAILVLSVRARGLTQVWIGWDENVTPFVVNQSLSLFQSIPFVNPTLFNVTDDVEVANALSNAEVVYLCPSFLPITLSPINSVLFSGFVSSGGIVIYPAGFNDTRSRDVAGWLQKPVLQVESIKFSANIDQIYSYPYRVRGSLGDPYANHYVALPTNQSLNTTFGRISPEHQFGLPFQWFSDNLYWVNDNIHHMILTPENREFCMFQRNGTYQYQSRYILYGSLNEACWVFNFRHDFGYVVEISMSFETPTAVNLPFTERFIGVVAAAVGQSKRAMEKFDPKPNNVLLKYKSQFVPVPVVLNPKIGGSQSLTGRGGGSGPASLNEFGVFANVAYDLSLLNNVFVWRRTEQPRELERLLSLTGAKSFFLLELPSASPTPPPSPLTSLSVTTSASPSMTPGYYEILLGRDIVSDMSTEKRDLDIPSGVLTKKRDSSADKRDLLTIPSLSLYARDRKSGV